MTTRPRATKDTKVLVGLAAIVLLLRSTQPLLAQAIPDDFVITLERTQCFGECPVYKVSIDATGRVVYEGTQYVRVAGRQTDRVEASQVAALVATVERIGFFQLDDVYRTARTADGLGLVVSDLPTTFVTVTSQGRTKRVEDYYNAPAGLRELETQIDETARTQRWTRIEELMMQQLLADNWVPSSSERVSLRLSNRSQSSRESRQPSRKRYFRRQPPSRQPPAECSRQSRFRGARR